MNNRSVRFGLRHAIFICRSFLFFDIRKQGSRSDSDSDSYKYRNT